MSAALATSAPTMSSLEIADLTGKQHKHVLSAIKMTLAQAGINWADFSAQYKDASGKQNVCFNLPRFECDLVVSGYSVKYRAAIIRRWHELEAERNKPLSRVEQLRREIAQLEAGESATTVIEAIRPIHEYGAPGPSGRPKIGLRRAAWVATRRSRLEEAAAINRELRELDQLEMDLMVGGGA